MKYELIYKNLPCAALRVFVEIEWCGPPDDTMVLHWTERENLKIFTIFFSRMGAAILEYCLETSGGLAKFSEPIRLQHSYHVTFSEIPSEMRPKCIQSFPKLSQLYLKCIPNNSCIPVECILPALYHTLGRGVGQGGGSVQGVSIQEVSIIQ